MDKPLICPYCGQEKNKEPGIFCNCHICGYKSAIVKGADGADLLIVDRRMPYLERRCRDLSGRMPGVSVIVDRRIAQDELAGADRRVQLTIESETGGNNLLQAG